MRRHFLIKLAVAAALALGSAQLLYVADASGLTPEAPPAKAEKKKGGGFASALAAPFRALGRLFGGGKKEKKEQAVVERKDGQKEESGGGGRPQRLTENDAANFQSATTMRVSYKEATSATPVAPAAASPQALVAEARVLLTRDEFGEAISLLSSAASADPNLAEAHHLLGYAYDRKGLRQLSLDAYQRALKLAPNDPQLLNDYGYTLFLRGQLKEAKDLLKRAAKRSPGDERVWNNLAVVQVKLEQYDDAFKSFTRAGGEFKGHMNVANAFERGGRYEDALKHYEAARGLNPASRAALQHLADVYQRLGRAAEAEAARHALGASKQDKAKSENGDQ
jgi:Flp pilus assembly protein TadD